MSLTLSSSVTLISAPWFSSSSTISVCPSIQVITSGVRYIIIIIIIIIITIIIVMVMNNIYYFMLISMGDVSSMLQ